VKRGDRRVLAAWGFAAPVRGTAELAIVPPRVRIGGSMELRVQLQSTAKRTQQLVVDYVVHHVRAGGRTSPKVWKGWRVELPAGEGRSLAKRHSWRPTTIRVDRPGAHAVDLLVNGRVVARGSFDLRG
jgi:hypothetical protein